MLDHTRQALAAAFRAWDAHPHGRGDGAARTAARIEAATTPAQVAAEIIRADERDDTLRPAARRLPGDFADVVTADLRALDITPEVLGDLQMLLCALGRCPGVTPAVVERLAADPLGCARCEARERPGTDWLRVLAITTETVDGLCGPTMIAHALVVGWRGSLRTIWAHRTREI